MHFVSVTFVFLTVNWFIALFGLVALFYWTLQMNNIHVTLLSPDLFETADWKHFLFSLFYKLRYFISPKLVCDGVFNICAVPSPNWWLTHSGKSRLFTLKCLGLACLSVASTTFVCHSVSALLSVWQQISCSWWRRTEIGLYVSSVHLYTLQRCSWFDEPYTHKFFFIVKWTEKWSLISTSNFCCSLDPISTFLLKKC